MLTPTTLEFVASRAADKKIFTRYGGAGIVIGSTANDTIELLTPAINTNTMTNREFPTIRINSDESIALELHDLKISCLSADFSIWLFNKTGTPANLKDTIYEVFASASANKRFALSEGSLNTLPIFIRNYDSTPTGKLYLYIENTGVASGEISVELVFTTMHDGNWSV